MRFGCSWVVIGVKLLILIIERLCGMEMFSFCVDWYMLSVILLLK